MCLFLGAFIRVCFRLVYNPIQSPGVSLTHRIPLRWRAGNGAETYKRECRYELREEGDGGWNL